MAAPSEKQDDKALGACVLAAVLWLVLALYLFLVVPNTIDLQGTQGKPEQLQATGLTRLLADFQAARGTAILAVLGWIGCGLAYTRRSQKIANLMILAGAILICVLIAGTVGGFLRVARGT